MEHDGGSIRVGILHSLSGGMALSEKPLVDAALMAIDEINAAGGLLGRKVKAIVEDGCSEPGMFANKAGSLVAAGIDTIFGCWTSSSRKAVKPIVEGNDALLWYPVQYEGLEQSPNIIYTGSCLNQQIEVGVNWALSQGMRHFLLVGSDYVFPRTANGLIRSMVLQGGGVVLDEQYAKLGSDDFAGIANTILESKPEMVFNTINGDSNLAFFPELKRAMPDNAACAVMSFSLSETELQGVIESAAGHYACWSYFQSVQSPLSKQFQQAYRQRYGQHSVVSDPIVTAYTQVFLWASAVEKANSFEAKHVVGSAPGCSFEGPSGVVELQANHHVKKGALIGQANSKGQFDVIWSSSKPIDPKPWLGVEDMEHASKSLVLHALNLHTEVIHSNVELEEQVRKRTASLEKNTAELEALNTKLSAANNELEAQCEILAATADELLVSQDELKQSGEVLKREQNLFLGGPVVAFLWANAENWPVEYVSPTISQFGYSVEDWLSGKVQFAKIVHEDDIARVANEVSTYSKDGRSYFEQRYRIYTADRRVCWVYDYTNIIRNELGEITHYHGFILDVSSEKQAEDDRISLERQVLQAQKLESLGILAGGIAHDFNNLLMVIMGNADLALDQLSQHSPARGNISEIETASKRAAGLAKQMLAYSGKGKFTNEAIDLNEFVDEMSHLLEVCISKKAVLKFDFADNLPLFQGDATQIRQIIMNLIVNASEAVGDKSGIVSISTGAMDCTREYLDSTDCLSQVGIEEPHPEGIYVYLEIADTGCGMDRGILENIFDPFFTTKFTGRGLGLAATLGIVRGHFGAIKVYSEVGKGTTFKVLFPSCDFADADDGQVSSGQDEKWHGSGTILIADDEESVIAVGKQMLNRRGFNVLTACDGREAVKVFREHQDEIVCVILDLTMPHLDGNEAFREMRTICPDVKVLLCSGFNEQEATQRFTGKGLAGFVHKPYSMNDLFEKLKQVLEG